MYIFLCNIQASIYILTFKRYKIERQRDKEIKVPHKMKTWYGAAFAKKNLCVFIPTQQALNISMQKHMFASPCSIYSLQ